MTASANWIQQAREKIEKHAGTQTKDDQAVAEAFAQQAYTAVGNRDRRIMCDPYLLGFEIVDKNEENNRLVGVFAFRVSGEILMVPVFFLNGKIKGQDLLYRKPVNRFYPNTEKWINFFVGRGEDETGRPVDRRNNADARIHLGVDRMSRMPGSYKRASEEAPIDIKAEWKEACDNSGFRPEHIEQYMFADFLANTGMGKQAADLARRVPWFADSIVLAGLLDKPYTKKAAAPKRGLEYHVDPIPGSTEEQVSAHFLRGYSFVDKRAAETLSTAVDSSPFSRTWSSVRKVGINYAAGKDGTFQKVLWAPTTSGEDMISPSSVGPSGPRYSSYPEHRLVFLEGPDKGAVLTYGFGHPEDELPLFTDDAEFDWRDKGEEEKEADKEANLLHYPQRKVPPPNTLAAHRQVLADALAQAQADDPPRTLEQMNEDDRNELPAINRERIRSGQPVWGAEEFPGEGAEHYPSQKHPDYTDRHPFTGRTRSELSAWGNILKTDPEAGHFAKEEHDRLNGLVASHDVPVGKDITKVPGVNTPDAAEFFGSMPGGTDAKGNPSPGSMSHNGKWPTAPPKVPYVPPTQQGLWSHKKATADGVSTPVTAPPAAAGPPTLVTSAPAAPPIPATPPAGEPTVNPNTAKPFGFVTGPNKAANSFGNELAIGAPLGAGLGLLAGPSLGVSPLEGMVGGGLLGTAGASAYHHHNQDPGEQAEEKERVVLHARQAAGQPLAPEEKARLVELLARYRQSKQARELKIPGSSSPEKGKVYVVWLPKLERLFGQPFRIDSLESTGDVTKINFESGHNYGEGSCRLILRKDLEETCWEDLRGGLNGQMPRVIGSDAVWIEVLAQVQYDHGMPKTPANVCTADFQPPASFQPVTLSTIDEALANSKKASLTIERNPRSGLLALRDHNGKIRVEDYTPRRMAIKLARDLRLPGDEAIELVNLAQTQVKTAFNLLSPGYMDALSVAFTGMTQKEAAWLKEAKEFDALMEKDAGTLLGRLANYERVLGAPVRTAFKVAPKSTAGTLLGGAVSGTMAGMAADKLLKPKELEAGAAPLPPLAAPAPGTKVPTPAGTAPTPEGEGMVDKLKGYATNPYVLGSLALGGGAAAYAASHQGKKKKKRTPAADTDGDDYEDKEAHAQFYDRDIDPDEDFEDYDYEEDLGLPVENSGQFQDFAEARRERFTRPAQNYLDAHDPGQGRNSQRHEAPDHIPDEVILRMVHPMQEMAQLGQQMGLDTLMDHGAVASMVKVYDVKPYMRDYISKLENSLDHLGRLVFMLYWKPRDFSELFGQDDLPQMENKLTGVFSSYGDLILELLQSSGEKG